MKQTTFSHNTVWVAEEIFKIRTNRLLKRYGWQAIARHAEILQSLYNSITARMHWEAQFIDQHNRFIEKEQA